MEKSKLGLPVGVVAAVACLFCLYGGYVIAGILVGYILLKEENMWLKKFSVSIVALMLLFSLASSVISLIPNLMNILYDFLDIFGVHFYISFIGDFFNLLGQVLSIAKTVVFVLLGVMALLQKIDKVPFIGKLVDKYMD